MSIELDILPEDILLLIFDYFDPFTALICEQVSKKWNRLSQKIWSSKTFFFVDHLYYSAKQKYDFDQQSFDRLCVLLLKHFGVQMKSLQLSKFRHDAPVLYTVRGLPMSPSAMRIYLQRINHQFLSRPKWNPLPGKPLSSPELASLVPYLNVLFIQNLCLYDVKLAKEGFGALKNFINLRKLILWPTAISWNSCPRQIILEALNSMSKLETVKLFTLMPDLLTNLPLSVTYLKIHLINTTVTRTDNETKFIFQINLHNFIELHPQLTKLSVLIRTRHLDYCSLIEHLSTFAVNLRSLKCQYNFKRRHLDLSHLKCLRHFGVQQKFLIGYELDNEKESISLNVAKTLASNEFLSKLSFENCFLKNSRRLPSWLNLKNITTLNLCNVFEGTEGLLHSLFRICSNLHIISLNNVKPISVENMITIGASCKLLTDLSVITEDDEIFDVKKLFIDNLVEELWKDSASNIINVRLENRQFKKKYFYAKMND